MKRRSLPIGSRLDRYVATHFVSSYAVALLLIVGLFWILDLASNLDDYLEPWPDGTVVGTSVLVRYYLFNLPYLLLQVAPFVTLVAGMFTVNKLLKKNEIVAVLAAGLSTHRLLLPVFLGGVLAVIGMFGVREWVTATIGDDRDALLDSLENKRTERRYERLWIRDLNGSWVRLGTYRPGTEEQVPEVTDLEAILRAGDEVVMVSAPSAEWTSGDWTLVEGTCQIVGEEKSDTAVDRLEGFEFTPDLALTYRRARDNPLELSFSEVQDLIRRSPESVVFQTLWHYHLTFPLANLVLLLVGVPVMLGFERGRGSERLALGGLLCLFYFGLDFVFRNMGLSGGLSPLWSAWLPVLVFGSLGIVLYDSMRS